MLESRSYSDEEWENGGKIESRKIMVANMVNKRKRMVTATSMSCFSHFADKDVYLPMKADYRGRLYTIPHEVSYQNGDMNRAMLWFKDGKACRSTTTENWLRRQIANLWGWDKKSIDERLKFVDQYGEKIKKWVSDPQDTYREWGEASDPWQFIAAAKEWVDYTNNKEHIHSLPIGMDASNNGLQILSILAGDELGCIATNVLPSDEPQDFYNLVVDKVTAVLEKGGNKFSRPWLDVGIDRKCVKTTNHDNAVWWDNTWCYQSCR